VLLLESPGELGKVTEKSRLLGSIVQAVTGGISDNFSDVKQQETNCGRIINANCRQRRNLFIPEFQYNDGGRSVQYINAVSGTKSLCCI
jgi:hypothetical protein